MCLAMPGLVVEIAGKTALVDFGGARRKARIDLLPDARTGEYVLVHAGFVIQRLDTSRAEELLQIFRDLPAHRSTLPGSNTEMSRRPPNRQKGK
jgi:hydrogenase expression/formation protein HypC